MGEFEPAPAATRLGMLQCGHGRGFLAALADPAASRDEVLACIADDPRLDTQCERRVRYYADLVTALPVPLSAIVACTRGHDPEAEPLFAHEVLAACWRRGHAEARDLFANSCEESLVQGVGTALCGHVWHVGVDLPPGLAAAVAEVERRWNAPTGRAAAPCAVGDTNSLDELGKMGDVRLLSEAEALFTREDVLDDPARRLPDAERMRRVALLRSFVELPASVTLPLARQWRDRDDYSVLAAMRVLAKHAEPSDRPWLEPEVERHLQQDGGSGTVGPLQALTLLGDARSAPLLLRVVEQVRYSLARMRALEGLARMPDAPGAGAALRDALWDCEEGAAAAACGALPTLAAAARTRVAELATDPLADEPLRGAATRRLAAG